MSASSSTTRIGWLQAVGITIRRSPVLPLILRVSSVPTLPWPGTVRPRSDTQAKANERESPAPDLDTVVGSTQAGLTKAAYRGKSIPLLDGMRMEVIANERGKEGCPSPQCQWG